MRLDERIARTVLRAARPAAVGPRSPIPVQRRLTDLASALSPLPRGTTTRSARVGGVPGMWVAAPRASREHAVLHLHGGGYVIGSSRSHRPLVAYLSAAVGAPVFLADYRLAPEHPHPAALEDALGAYRGLGVPAESAAVTGDSAGGGLTVAVAMALRDEGAPPPAVLGLICPWLDLTLDVAGRRPERRGEPVLRNDGLTRWARAYVDGADAAQPAISPILGDLSGLPPIVVHTCGDDPLAPDGERLAGAAGVEVEHVRLDGLWHDVHLLAGSLRAARDAVGRLGSALAARLGTAP